MSPEWWEGEGFLQQRPIRWEKLFLLFDSPPDKNSCVTATSPSAGSLAAVSWCPHRGDRQGRKGCGQASVASNPNLGF